VDSSNGTMSVLPDHHTLGTCPGCPRRLSVLSGFHSKSFLCGAFVWACRELKSQKRRFPARAVPRIVTPGVAFSQAVDPEAMPDDLEVAVSSQTMILPMYGLLGSI
jgi:hypothetical protein